MQYIMSRQVNGLGAVFYNNSREVVEPVLYKLFEAHPEFFEDVTDVIVACGTSDEMFEWQDDEYQNNVIRVGDAFFMLDLDNVELRRNTLFINLMSTLPNNKSKIVDIPDDVVVWLQYRDDGSEWFCESHRTWG